MDTGPLVTWVKQILTGIPVFCETGDHAIFDQQVIESVFYRNSKCVKLCAKRSINRADSICEGTECVVGESLCPGTDKAFLHLLLCRLQGVIPVAAGIGDQTGSRNETGFCDVGQRKF